MTSIGDRLVDDYLKSLNRKLGDISATASLSWSAESHEQEHADLRATARAAL